MIKIDLETLSLCRYDEFLFSKVKEEFINGISASNFIHSIKERLEISNSNPLFTFQSAYIVVRENSPIGYVYVSGINNDEVYLEYSVLNKFRSQGNGTLIINEVCNYLYENYNIKSVKLDISPNNKMSIQLAEKCGFIFDEEDYENRNYCGNMTFIKDSCCYIPKKR